MISLYSLILLQYCHSFNFLHFFQIGKSLPCIDSVSELTSLELSKSIEALEYTDKAKFPVGPTCPVDRGSFIPENTKDFPLSTDNKFRARVIYELPPSESIADASELQ